MLRSAVVLAAVVLSGAALAADPTFNLERPDIKGGFIFAGGHGTAGVYEKDQLIGAAGITLASLGAQKFSFRPDAAAAKQ